MPHLASSVSNALPTRDIGGKQPQEAALSLFPNKLPGNFGRRTATRGSATGDGMAGRIYQLERRELK
jgi:hypothetical protein